MKNNQLSILLIEDNPIYKKVLKYDLGQSGWNVDIVSSEKEAKKYLSQLNPEIILVDILLSKNICKDFINDLTQIAKNSIVILIVGFSELKLAIDLLRDNICDYILKPFKIEQLVLVVEKARKLYFQKKEIEILTQENNQLKEIIIEKGIDINEIVNLKNDLNNGNYNFQNEKYAKQVRKSQIPKLKKNIKNS